MMNAPRFTRPLLAAAAVILVAAISAPLASVFLQEDVASLSKRSHAVVQARVVEAQSYWNAAGTMIFTDVALDVRGRLKGSEADRIVVRVPGGTVDGFTVAMEGAPRLVPGEDVVAFIERWDDGALKIAGYFQGVSKLEHDRAGNAFLRGGVSDGLPLNELGRRLQAAEGRQR